MTLESFRKTILAAVYLLCIPVIIYMARLVSHRTVTVSENALAKTVVSSGSFAVTLDPQEEPAYDVRIPLPPGLSPEDVTFESRYLDRTLYITLSTAQRGFYLEQSVACNGEKVDGITCLLQEDDTVGLLVQTKTLLDPAYRLESDALVISLTAPYETAEHVIVLDPLSTGAGSDVALSLALQLRDTLLSSPLSCRVFLTRTDANSAADEAVLSLIADSHATRYIRLDMPEGEAALAASVSLCDGFYIREYGNVPFASDVMRALTAVENLRPDGVSAVSDDTRLSGIRIPAVSVHIEGVRSSFGEDEKLLAELAQALCAALQLGYAPAE